MHISLSALAARHPAAVSPSALALKPVTLEIGAGEQLAIIGPSGSGKTTLLMALACALKPAAGQLSLDDIDPWTLTSSGLQKLRGRIVLAPQSPPLPPRQRVITAVLAGRLPQQSLFTSLKMLLHPSADAITAAYHALDCFDLGDKLWHRVDRLSGGERQRVGLARALVSAANLWLIDEPLSSLDPSRAGQAIGSLQQAAREQAATLITSLHQVDVAARFPRVTGLRDGEVQFDLPSHQVTPRRLTDLYAQHAHELLNPQAPPEAAVAATNPPRLATPHCR